MGSDALYDYNRIYFYYTQYDEDKLVFPIKRMVPEVILTSSHFLHIIIISWYDGDWL